MHGKSVLLIALLLILLGTAFAVGLSAFHEQKESAANIKNTKKDELITFLVFGDNEGTGPVLEKIIDAANTRGVDFVVQLGDATPRSEPEIFSQVQQAFHRFNAPLYAIPGNNDIVGDPAYAQWGETFGFDRWYTITKENTQFFFLDNAERKVGFPDDELTWLEKEIAQSTAKHKVLFYHRPVALPIEELFGDDETTASRASNDAFRNILKQYNIARIFNGHVHTYFPYTLDDIPVTVSGGGGALPQSILGGEAAAFYHFLIVRITADSITQELVPIRL
ncbi:MAG: metallophosphoesterase [Patescibacteria group bacterium]|jgi:predicted phosphodiesterase